MLFSAFNTTVTRSEASFLNGPADPPKGQWVTASTNKNKNHGGCFCCEGHSDSDSPSFDELRQLAGKAFAGTEKVPGEPSFDKLFAELSVPQNVKEEMLIFILSLFIKNSLAKGGVAFCYKADDLAGLVVVREYDPDQQKKMLYRIWTKLSDKVRELSVIAQKYVLKQQMPKLLTAPEYKRQSDILSGFIEGAMEEQIIPWHAEYGPKHKHWYVEIVGTHPAHHGRGIGRKLMTRVGQLADDQNMDCYLECSPENVGFYERFGYRQLAAKQIKKPDPSMTFQPTLHLMLRRSVGSKRMKEQE